MVDIEGDLYTHAQIAARPFVLQPTALDDRLIPKVLTIIERLGTEVTINDTYAVKSTPPYPYSRAFVNGDTIRAEDVLVYLAAQDIPVMPDRGQRVTFDGTNWTVVEVRKILSGQYVVLYALQLRGSGPAPAPAASPTTALDDRLIPKTAELVARLGRSARFTVPSGSYDPSTGAVGVAEAYHTHKVTPPDEYEDRYVDGDAIQEGDVRVYLPSLGLAFTPQMGQTVLMGAEEWDAISVAPIYSGRRIALYEIQLRR